MPRGEKYFTDMENFVAGIANSISDGGRCLERRCWCTNIESQGHSVTNDKTHDAWTRAVEDARTILHLDPIPQHA